MRDQSYSVGSTLSSSMPMPLAAKGSANSVASQTPFLRCPGDTAAACGLFILRRRVIQVWRANGSTSEASDTAPGATLPDRRAGSGASFTGVSGRGCMRRP